MDIKPEDVLIIENETLPIVKSGIQKSFDDSLAEMGATWVTVNDNYVPVLLPPYDYNNIKGVIKSTQNLMMIYDKILALKSNS